jgi:hypothetical protein
LDRRLQQPFQTFAMTLMSGTGNPGNALPSDTCEVHGFNVGCQDIYPETSIPRKPPVSDTPTN